MSEDRAGVDVVSSRTADGVTTVTLDAPSRENVLSRALLEQLIGHLEAASLDPAVRAIVLTHSGATFSSGADMAEAAREGLVAGSRRLLRAMRVIVDAPKPVIALVRGYVRGGGTGIVASADIVLATTQASFAWPEARLGWSPAVVSLPVSLRLDPRAMLRYFLTSEQFGAEEAARIGLITEVVGTDPASRLAEYLDDFRAASPAGLASAKRLVAAPLRQALVVHGEDMARRSADLFATSGSTVDTE